MVGGECGARRFRLRETIGNLLSKQSQKRRKENDEQKVKNRSRIQSNGKALVVFPSILTGGRPYSHRRF